MTTVSSPWWRPFKDAAKKLVESARLPTPSPDGENVKEKPSKPPMYRYSEGELSQLESISKTNGGLPHGQVSLLLDEIRHLRYGAQPSSNCICRMTTTGWFMGDCRAEVHKHPLPFKFVP